MNSSLPNFLATPAATAAAGANLLNASLSASLLPTATNADGAPPGLPEFAALMPPLPAAPLTTATVSNPSAALPNAALAVGVTIAAPGQRFTATAMTSRAPLDAKPWSRGALAPEGNRPGGGSAPLSETVATSFVCSTIATETPAPAETAGIAGTASVQSSTEVPATLREQAVAFAVTLLQSLLPEVTVPVQSAPVMSEASNLPAALPVSALAVGGQLAGATIKTSATVTAQRTLDARASSQPTRSEVDHPVRPSAGFKGALDVGSPLADAEDTSMEARASALPTVQAVGGQLAGATMKATATPLSLDSDFARASAFAEPAADRSSPPTQVDSRSPVDGQLVGATEPQLAEVAASAPVSPVAFAPDGAVELSLDLPPAVVEAVQALQAETLEIGATPIAIHATLELPGQPVLRIEVGETAAAVAPDAPSRAGSQRENFAAKKRTAKAGLESGATSLERNFEFTGSKQVKPWSPVAGIPVAKNDTIMSAAPTEEPRAARSPQDSTVLPVRAEFQVAQTSTERITVPAPGPSGQTFAARAVETVTGLVEAQFSASMQKSGSVHLRLKFGGEDLSVRVAIRDGAVHTDFHTDSAPLRAALEREWSAVAAASPEQMQRYAEPVFGAASTTPAEAQPSFARSSSQQAQPDAQQQQRAPREDAHPFNRRSLMSESFVPEPPAPRVATFLPTSLRLSALA